MAKMQLREPYVYERETIEPMDNIISGLYPELKNIKITKEDVHTRLRSVDIEVSGDIRYLRRRLYKALDLPEDLSV